MSPAAIKAYGAYRGQLKRCYKSYSNSYDDYGAKGIRVEYETREFMFWYMEKLKTFSGVDPVVGRIDHSKNYSFGNIEMISRTENTKERNERYGNPTAAKPVVVTKLDGSFVAEYPSGRAASRATGVCQADVQRCCQKEFKQSKGLIFTFKSGVLW